MTNKVGRPRKTESFRRLVAAALVEDPEIPTQELLRRATAEGYEGGKSAFYDLVATTREPTRARERRVFGPGECSRHDVVEIVVPAAASRRKIRLFVSCLEHSRLVAASVLVGSGIEPLARAMVAHFEAFGGVPLLAKLETRPPAEVVDAFAHLALDLCVAIELPTEHRTRGASSRIARMIRGEFVPPLMELGDDRDLVRHIEAYVAERNARLSSAMITEERRKLRPLPVPASKLAVRVPVVVEPPGVVRHEGREFVVSRELIGKMGTLHLGTTQIRVVVGESVTSFPRFFRP